MKKINHLDLFSGIGGFHLGFERAGFKINSFFSEIDKHSIAVYKHKFPNSTYVGSVTDVRGEDLPRIDLITFGSPCQDFSLAGKRKGMEGERSSLILEAIRLIGECRPRVFVWENVKGTFSSNNGEDFAAILQEFANIGGYRLEWQLLNTSWFLPQNRERIYLVGYSTSPKRNWRGVFPIGKNSTEVVSKSVKQIGTKLDPNSGTQPYQQDRVYDADGIVPVLNQGKSDLIVAMRGRYNEDGSTSQRLELNTSGKSNTLTAVQKDNMVIQVKSATSSGYEEATSGDSINLSNPNSETRRGRVGKQKAQTLETSCNQAVLEPMIYDGYNNKIKEDNIVGTITQHCSRSGMTNGFKVIQSNYSSKSLNETIENSNFIEGEPQALDLYNRVARDESPTLTEPHHNSLRMFDGYRIRRLTPIECERLQGFPDDHTAFGNYDGEVKPMSNTQRYKQCGNAVTVDVVEAVAKQCIGLL
jgi:DNA (cytosine-5)-methyltransferase 1